MQTAKGKKLRRDRKVYNVIDLPTLEKLAGYKTCDGKPIGWSHIQHLAKVYEARSRFPSKRKEIPSDAEIIKRWHAEGLDTQQGLDLIVTRVLGKKRQDQPGTKAVRLLARLKQYADNAKENYAGTPSGKKKELIKLVTSMNKNLEKIKRGLEDA